MFLCLALALASAGAIDDLKGASIRAIVVEDAQDESARESVLAVFGIGVGDTLDVRRVRLGIKRVFLTGAWADVQVSAARSQEPGDEGVVLFLKLVPDVLVEDVSGRRRPRSRAMR